MLSRLTVSIALLAAFISSTAAAEMCVHVDLRFSDREPSPTVVQTMQDEASSIWRTYAVQIEWSAATGVARCASSQGSFDVFIDHHQSQESARSLNNALGSTLVSIPTFDHVPIYIDQEATEHVLGSLTAQALVDRTGHPVVWPVDVGRALGRVLAHELGHGIVGARHQSHGLMRPVFLADDLVDYSRRSYTLSPAEVTHLRRREGESDRSISNRSDSLHLLTQPWAKDVFDMP